jgi:flagellar protein FliS
VNLDSQAAQASPVQLVLILMNGLLEELARVRAHIVARRYEEKAKGLDKSIEILNGMSSALDLDTGGEVVASLAQLYDYCAGRLYTAGARLDPSIVDEVNGILNNIRQGWLGVQARES